MGDVVKFAKPRQGTIRGAAREMLTCAMDSVNKPVAVVMVAIGLDGTYAVRMANYPESIEDFDTYARAAAVLDRAKMGLLDPG